MFYLSTLDLQGNTHRCLFKVKMYDGWGMTREMIVILIETKKIVVDFHKMSHLKQK